MIGFKPEALGGNNTQLFSERSKKVSAPYNCLCIEKLGFDVDK